MQQNFASTNLRVTYLFLIAVATIALQTTAIADESDDPHCPWIGATEVNRLVTDGAPWTAGSVTRDSCRFAGERNGNTVIIGIERTLHDDAEDARAQAQTLRKDLEGALNARNELTIGEAGFSGHSQISGGELVQASGHRGAAFVNVRIADPSGTTDNQRDGATQLVDAVLDDGLASRADEPECPWLTPDLALDLVPGGVLTHSRDEICELSNEDLRLVVEVKAQSDADDLIQYMYGQECTHEPVPSLGGNARVAWDCSGRPGIAVIHAEDDRLVIYRLRHGTTEAPPALRERLVEIAVAMRDARGR